MIHSRRGPLRRVALSVTLLAGVFASFGVFSSPAHASTPATTKTTKTTFTLYCNTGIANGDCVSHDHPDLPGVGRGRGEVQDQVEERDHGRGRVGLGCIRHSPGWLGKGHVTTDNDLSTDATPKSQQHRRDGGHSRRRHHQQRQRLPDLYAAAGHYTEEIHHPLVHGRCERDR